jgi:plasmid stabilization system protein ParE
MRLRFTPRAVENIREIAAYIRARNPDAGDRVRADIFRSLRSLVLFPKVGRRQATAGVRKVVTRKYHYLIYYTLDEAKDAITILNVKHKAREREHSDV